MTIYFLSGLGADKRMFSKLKLPEQLKIKYINWLPQAGNETLKNYSKRLLAQIDTSTPFQLVGLSFGGIVATENSLLLKEMPPNSFSIVANVLG